MSKQTLYRSQAPVNGGAALAMASRAGQNIGKGISNLGSTFTEYGQHRQEEQNNAFLNQINQAGSTESVQALLSAVPQNTSIDPTKLQSFSEQRVNQLRTNEERLLQDHVNQNYQNPSQAFTPNQENLMSPFQRSTRNDITAQDFISGSKFPERGESAVQRHRNLQTFRNDPKYQNLNPASQKLAEASYLQSQGNDIKNIGSLSQAQDYDSNRSAQSLLNATRTRTNTEAQSKKELLSRLNQKDTVYSPSEYAALPAEARKGYDRSRSVPIIKKYRNLGRNIEEKVSNYMGAMQSPDVQNLSIPQQQIVSDNLMKLGGFNQSTINDQLEFSGYATDEPTPKDRPFVPGFVDGWLNNRGSKPNQEPQIFVSPEIDTQILNSLQAGATVDQLRSSQLYQSNPELIEALLRSMGGK